MTQQTMFLKNTETFAESLARCGVKFHFAYPITPATDVMKRMAVILPQYGGKMLQMESELAVSSALAGAACTGMLCATSSSGPGMTLMQEAISFMCGAELPCLMLDSMRVGPGDGDILGAQSDYYMSTRGGGHGDYHVPVLAPSDGQEIKTVDEIAQDFRINEISSSNSIFEYDKLNWMNSHYIKMLSIPELKERLKPYLKKYDLNELTDAQYTRMVEITYEPLTLLSDITEAVPYFFGEEVEIDEKAKETLDTEVSQEVLKTFTEQAKDWEWTEENLHEKLEAFRAYYKEKGVKPKVTMWAIRAAVTGRICGADMTAILAIIGKEKTFRRVNAAMKAVK